MSKHATGTNPIHIAHTPGPWTVDVIKGYPTALGVGRNGGKAIAVLTRDAHASVEEQAANAHFIVRAANSHDVMIAALKEVLKYRRGNGEYDFSQVPADQRDNAAFDAWENVEQQILAALYRANMP